MKRKIFEFLALCFLTLALPFAGFGQSRDRDHPKPMRSSELKGDLGSGEESFHSFVAGPGEVKITVDVESSDGTAVLEFELLDKNAANKIICCEFAQADSAGQSGRTIKSTKLARSQTVVLHLTRTKGGRGVYRVRVDGAVSFRDAEGDR